MKWCTSLLLTMSLMSSNAFAAQEPMPERGHYGKRPEVLAFIEALSQKEDIPLAWLKSAVKNARYCAKCERLTTPTKSNKTFRETPTNATSSPRDFAKYREQLINKARIVQGVAFAHAYRDTLETVALTRHVDPWIVVAIIGIETQYGRQRGRTRVLDSLMTLSFDYTRRASFYKEELAQYLTYTYREGLLPNAIKGSYTGALGYPQFMPSSITHFGADGDDDGHIDLFRNPRDAIASVGRYLEAHHWDEALPVRFPVHVDMDEANLPTSGKRPTLTWAEWQSLGVSGSAPESISPTTPLMVYPLHEKNESGFDRQWWAGTTNTGAILHYNPVRFYAAGVTELAEAIKAAYYEKYAHTPSGGFLTGETADEAHPKTTPHPDEADDFGMNEPLNKRAILRSRHPTVHSTEASKEAPEAAHAPSTNPTDDFKTLVEPIKKAFTGEH